MKRFALDRTEGGAERVGMSERGRRPGPLFSMMVVCVPAGLLTLISALLLGHSLLAAMIAAMWGLFVLALAVFLLADALETRGGGRREGDTVLE
ncbi:hypothetical protein [Rhodovulum sulfidophilum]|uniref:hypothetical protein n=1 Tax=Rhodovulum sulfidophilum TaxID=35806 RepID=UPI00138A64A1|nr:hypothetical protein [Rhodovulum sulfidophilum]NDK34500.1 hypothetical protein [Rhodovulum sulfidophilum]